MRDFDETRTLETSLSEVRADEKCDNCKKPLSETPKDSVFFVQEIFRDEIMEMFYCSKECLMRDMEAYE